MFRPNARSNWPRERGQTIAKWMRAGGVRSKLLTLFVLAVVLVALLPLIVAKSPLRNMLLSRAVPSDALRITVGDASLSWLSGPSLSGVEVNDPSGNTMLAAESISVDRAPLNLLKNSRDLGLIQITRPRIHIKVRPDGSNLEDAVNKLLAHFSSGGTDLPNDSTVTQPVEFAIQLVEGSILAEDVATGRQWRIDGVNLQYDCHGANGGIGSGSLAGQIMVAAQQGAAPVPAGRLALSLKPGEGGRQEVGLQADGVALALAEPWLRRIAAGSEISGTLSANGSATFTANGQSFPTDLTTSGTLAIDQFDATAAALSGDRVRLTRVELPWRIAAQPNGLEIQDLQLKSDVGRIGVRGRLDPATPDLNGRHDLELRGTLDVARLATMLPNALRIRDDTKITSGTIDIAGSLKSSADGQAITGSVSTAQLEATSGGKPLRWDQPVSANFALHRTNGAVALDSLRCDSKFLRIEAAGTPEQVTTNAYFDLNSLAEQLGQFVDLTGMQLAGTGTAQIAWQQTEKDKFSATASSDLSQLRIALSDGAVWAEPQLALRAEAAGLIDPLSHQLTRVDTAQLRINGQGDQLDAKLTSPVALTKTDSAWSVAVRSSGSIARWLTRVRPWFAPDPWKIDGTSELTANIRATGNMFEATNAKVVVTDLRATGPGWNIHEPRAEFTGDAHVNLATGEIAANTAQLVTSTVSLATQNVRYGKGDGGISQMMGAAAFRADVARLAAWRAAMNGPAEYLPTGEFTGNIRFAQQSGRITGEVAATGQSLGLATRAAPAAASGTNAEYQTIWQEPRLTLRGATTYDASADRLTFNQFEIQSNTLQAGASGQIERLSTTAECNLKGTLNYDLAQVSPLLRPYIGNGIQLVGREQARFNVAGKLNDEGGPRAQLTGLANDPYRTSEPFPGPSLSGRGIPAGSHWSRRVRAQLELPWSSANVYGLPVGAGRITATLGDGALRVEPLSLTVGEGQLNLAPNVRFDPEPSELTMPAGPVITNVRISPEVSEAMLKFVAPVLAGATQSEGHFSMQLDGARVPLADAKKADSGGKLTVHSVRVVPGPMTQQWVGLAQQIESLAKRRDPTALAARQPVNLLAIRDQQVNFRVVNGRVYHQNIEFQVGDVTLRSQGSVGLDETVQLTLQIPIQDAWVTKEPLLAGLKGQSLQVPVSGTLTRPQMDQRTVANLSGQLIQNAAGQAVGSELNKALDKFLRPRQ